MPRTIIAITDSPFPSLEPAKKALARLDPEYCMAASPSADDILAAVHRFYDEYYFRPKAVFRILRRAAFDSSERKRLYKEAKTFLKLRAARNKMVKKHAQAAHAAPASAVGMSD